MGLGKLRILKPAVLSAIGIGIAAGGLRVALRGLDWPTLGKQILGLDWRWLAAAVGFDTASYAAQGLRWRCLLEGASLWQTTRAIYAGLFLNEIIPFRPGEAVRGWLAARDLRMGLAKIAPTMLAERLMDGAWLVAALLTTLALAPLPPAFIRVSWIVVAAVVLLFLLALILGRARYPVLAGIRRSLANHVAFLASGLFLMCQGLAFWSVSRASHLRLGVAAAFVVMLAVRIGTMIPTTPANLGTHQVFSVLGLSLYGVPQSAAATFSLVVFVVLTAPLLLIGFAAILDAGLDWQTFRQRA